MLLDLQSVWEDSSKLTRKDKLTLLLAQLLMIKEYWTYPNCKSPL